MALLGAYLLLSLAVDPRGFLGTDTGGKVATLVTMEHEGTLEPVVGYWAEDLDPDGDLHPLFYTERRGGEWVNVTTLPMLYAGYPLWRLGGYRAVLLIPMAGAVAAALAAGALVRRLGDDGRLGFWLVGLASPAAIYALDFWEHSIGVALGAWALVLLTDVMAGRPALARSAGAGLLFGAAATMRTEMLVYAAAAIGAAGAVVLARQRKLLAPLLAGAAFAVALALPVAINHAVESRVVGDAIRGPRAAQTLAEGGGHAGDRIEEAAVTFVGLDATASGRSLAAGATLAALVALAAGIARRRPDVAAVALAGAAGLYAVRFSDGLGFVPGLLAATPLAAVGLARAWRRSARPLAAIALLALPVVWALQYRGGAQPQWGGRYILLSGLLLGVVGIASLRRMPRALAVACAGLAVAVTVYGLAWTSVRTHDVARVHEELASRAEPVIVFGADVAHLPREGGAFYAGSRWLLAMGPSERTRAAGVVEAAGHDTFLLVSRSDTAPPVVPGWEAATSHPMEYFPGDHLVATKYQR